MIRQEAINVHLANLLCEIGFRAAAERIKRLRKSPDLTLMHPTLGVMLGEAEIGNSWADEEARKRLETRALERFNDPQFNYIDFVLMVIYPRALIQKISGLSEHEITNVLAKNEVGMGLAYRITRADLKTVDYSWYPRSLYPTQIPVVLEDLTKGVLGAMLRPEEAAERTINLIEEASEHVLNNAKISREAMDFWLKVARQLEIDVDALRDKVVGAYLAAKMLFTLIAVSVMIYEIARIRHPSKLPSLSSPLSFHAFAKAIEKLREVNYVEVIDAIHDELLKVPSESTLINILNELCTIIRNNISILMRSGWESLAMIYQKLLSETYRKAYATFYTKLPAARLLSELSIEGPWDEVIDPAGGTGSLLLSSFYVRQWLALNPSMLEEILKEPLSEPTIDMISKDLLERTYGMDALKAAVALSCAGLTIASLAVPHKRLNLFHTPVGALRAGSLDLLINRGLLPEALSKRLSTFDLAIMNPPFTRSDRIPTLIGNKPRKDLIEKKLKFGGEELNNLFVAGLAKPFLVLAESLIHENGRIAAVLPTSILSRSSWADVRKGIVKAYTLEHLVVSWAAGTPSFSSDTTFREILIVLKKGKENKPVTVINLLEPVESLDMRDIAVIAHRAKGLEGGAVMKIGREKTKIIAKIAKLDQKVIEKHMDNMYRLIAFLSPELLEWHINLVENCCVKLGELFEVGSVVDHAKGLRIVEEKVNGGYPSIWGSSSKFIFKPLLEPTHSIIVEGKAKVKFWERPKSKTFFFSDLFILRRGHLGTQSVLSFKTSIPIVSNVWWPLKPKDEKSHSVVPAFLAFMNSTFGFIHLLGERLETGGLFVEYKKEHLENMPIPDFRKADLINLEEIMKILTVAMPRFDGYFKEMAKLERQFGDWKEAINQVEKDGKEAPRVALDKITSEIIAKICPKITPPKKLYELVHEDIERLQKIMERKRVSEKIVAKDTGEVGVKKKGKITSLDRWINTSS